MPPLNASHGDLFQQHGLKPWHQRVIAQGLDNTGIGVLVAPRADADSVQKSSSHLHSARSVIAATRRHARHGR